MTKKSVNRSWRRPVIPDSSTDDSKSATRISEDEGTSTGKRRRSERIRQDHAIYKAEDNEKSATRKIVKADEGTFGKRRKSERIPEDPQINDSVSKSATRKPLMKADGGTARKRKSEPIPIYHYQTQETSVSKEDEATGKRRRSERIRQDHAIYKAEDTSDEKSATRKGKVVIADEGTSGKRRKSERIPQDPHIYPTQINDSVSVSATRKPVEATSGKSICKDAMDNLGRKSPLALALALPLPTFQIKKRRSGLGPAPQAVAPTVLQSDDPGSRLSDLAQYKLQRDEVDALAEQQQAIKAAYEEAFSKMQLLQDRLMAKELIFAESKDERIGVTLIVKAGFGGRIHISPIAKEK